MLATNISVLKIENTRNSQELEVTLNIDDQERIYLLKVFDDGGILGLDMEVELQDLITCDSKKFIESIFSFYEGNMVSLPINLSSTNGKI